MTGQFYTQEMLQHLQSLPVPYIGVPPQLDSRLMLPLGHAEYISQAGKILLYNIFRLNILTKFKQLEMFIQYKCTSFKLEDACYQE